MADIRIKDLATLESASLTGDVFVIDGTTGTRKLSAFSPTFGGNATVTGTLTSNGGVIIPAAGSISTLTSTNATHVANATWGALSQGYGTTADWSVFNKSQGTVMYVPTGTSNLFLYGKLDANTLSVYSTTASTTTSTGALVVGNGTSGGLGVGGAIYAGGNLLITGTGKIGAVTAADSRFHVYESSAVDVGNGVTIEQAGTGDAVTAFLLTGVQRWSVGIDNSDSDKFKIGTGALGSADRLTIDTSGNLAIPASTASTSTSSGALVVSGGVGVAKELYVGSATESTSNTTGGLVLSGGLGVALNLNMGGRLFINNTSAANGTLSASSIVSTFGADGVLGGLGFTVKGFPSATAGSRYIQLAAADTLDFRELRINDLGGNVLLGGATSTVKIGGSFQVGNAYVAGAPTATGYIVIKDSTGTSYKIPAQAL
jgi:hypothetical protein